VHKESLDTVSLLLESWPDASREKDSNGLTPLHYACSNGASLDVVSLLLKSWPGAVREKDSFGLTPLHYAIRNGTSSDIVSLLFTTWPGAAKEKSHHGRSALYYACTNRASLDVVSLLLTGWPDAAKEKDSDGQTLLHTAIEKQSPIEVIILLLNKWLKVKENRNFHDVESLKQNASNKVERLLSRFSSLLKYEANNSSPNEVMNFIMSNNLHSGVALVINKYPSVAKTLGLQTDVMADFLCVVGRYCTLKTMWEVITNEQELLEYA